MNTKITEIRWKWR